MFDVLFESGQRSQSDVKFKMAFDTRDPFVLSERNPWTHLSFKIGKCSGVKSKLKRGLWEMRSCKQQNPDAAQ